MKLMGKIVVTTNSETVVVDLLLILEEGKVLEFHLQTDYFGETPPCRRSCMSGAWFHI